MPRTPQTTEDQTPETPAPKQDVQISAEVLAEALAKAIATARPERITVANRKKNTPWTPKDGSPKLKLKRRIYQHGQEVLEERMLNQWIELANKLRPGKYCDGYITVIRRRDKGLDITYPVKTQAQRMKLVTEFGLRDFGEILARCVSEADTPKSATGEEQD